MFLQQLINGVIIGAIYAIVALGYSMVYSVLQIVNWAHADVLMIGTFVGLIFMTQLGMPVIVMVVLAAAVTAALGMAVERVAYRPIKKNRKMAVLVSALGMSVFLQNLAQLMFGSSSRAFPTIKKVTIRIGGVAFTNMHVIIIAVTVVMLAILYVLVYRTKVGVAMRACSVSLDNAKLMGINPNRIIGLTFGLGAFFAGIAGICIGTFYDAVYATMGYRLGMKAFAAAILGGIGSIPGAVLGGFIIGIVESLGAGYISTGYQDAYAFIIMIVILALRPSGLMGARQINKV
ncbi:MAG: branched-chain amino acid ABC transporter permease [Oscillospiraceae bacterium]|jgi:branched-chain amino acid transport system permease protein|nr:branched-chain amino acid ABC transporter permease [Oscillospiraceae bacterium]